MISQCRPVLSRRTGCSLWILLALLVLALARAEEAGNAAPDAPASSGRFIALGDLHFDPFAGLTRDGFAELMAAPFPEWPARLAHQPPAAYGSDAPWSLILGALDDARARCPDPDWVFVAGDLLGHEWANRYDRIAPRTRTDDPAAFDAFTGRVMQFLADALQAHFPTAPIFPVPGNDDSDCGDYRVTPRSRFLAMCAETWSPLVVSSSSSERPRNIFRKTVSRGGYYTVRLPHLPHHRLIAMNTVFFSPQYSNACGDPAETPAREEFRWLESTLTAAGRANETVWLLMHLPPGIDSFETWQAKGSAQPLWQPELAAWFLNLLQRHPNRVQVAFAGHTHMDDFRLVQLRGQPVLLTKVIPGISPIYGNNPGYHRVTYERSSGQLRDYETRWLPLSQPARLEWISGYSFTQAYPGFQLDPESLLKFGGEVRSGGDVASIFRRHYSTGAPLTPIPSSALGCAILNVTVGGYSACSKPSAGRD